MKWPLPRTRQNPDEHACDGHPAESQLDAATDAEIGYLADGGRRAWETYRCTEGHWHARPVPLG